MRFQIIISVSFVFIFSFQELFAQEVERLRDRSSLQLTSGVAHCFQYNAQATLSQYDEGGFPVAQTPSFSLNVNLSYFYKLNAHNSLKAGVGLGGYRYLEEGMSGNGDGTFSPYSGSAGWIYSDFSAGFRRLFSPEEKVSFFLEFDALYELAVQPLTPLNGGLALQQKMGASIASSGNSRFIVAAFFKSGIMRYNDLRYGNAYIPYAYGLQVGWIGRR